MTAMEIVPVSRDDMLPPILAGHLIHELWNFVDLPLSRSAAWPRASIKCQRRHVFCELPLIGLVVAVPESENGRRGTCGPNEVYAVL